jgi:hypothetical protein
LSRHFHDLVILPPQGAKDEQRGATTFDRAFSHQR